ncbi:hypothetical protein [Ensifer aridi]|uniref:hypothetical protein n=1 Tax=Ensifer aridi TaxID=1708715 RepID=UPI000A0F9904|nr:hypothetical protein [Ensifer aridi]
MTEEKTLELTSDDALMIERLLRAMDRRDPWSADDLIKWLHFHFPGYIREVEEPNIMDEFAQKNILDVLRVSSAALREDELSHDDIVMEFGFYRELRTDFGYVFPHPEVDTAAFALRVAAEIDQDPAFPLIVRNLLNIAADCIDVEASRIEKWW